MKHAGSSRARSATICARRRRFCESLRGSKRHLSQQLAAIGGRAQDRAKKPFFDERWRIPQRQVTMRKVGGLRGNARLHGIARSDSPNAPVFGRSRGAGSGQTHREHLLDFEMHHVVAFASRRGEPRRVDFDQAASFGPDCTTGAQLAHQQRHGRTSHTEDLRERLLGEREHIMVDAVAKLEQPARHPRFDRVKRVAGRTELEVYQ